MISIGGMDNQRLGKILMDLFPQLTGEPGFWKAELENHLLMIMTDETHDRMRIMIPVCQIMEDQLDLDGYSLLLYSRNSNNHHQPYRPFSLHFASKGSRLL